MGSSPVTATTSAAQALRQFLRSPLGLCAGQPLVVAFSGGSDSTALLAAAVRQATAGEVIAAHFDHRLDPDSGRRAAIAEELARGLGATWIQGTVDRLFDRTGGAEAWARDHRYRFLERVRRQTGATAVLTAHHRRDQAETVLMRILYGSGVFGLSCIQPWIAGVGRPWLDIAAQQVREEIPPGVKPVSDPTNADPRVLRNRIRRDLLPRLAASDPEIELALANLATECRRMRLAASGRVAKAVGLQTASTGPSLDLDGLKALPPGLWAAALHLLQPTDGIQPRQSVNAGAVAELRRQLASGGRLAVTLGGDHEWKEGGGRLQRTERIQLPSTFSHRLSMPGEVRLSDGSRMTVEAEPIQTWMTQGRSNRAALDLPAGASLGVRSRRPGDRIQPLGCDYRRKLKNVLIDAKVPRDRRDRLPLLTLDDHLVWVPGVTIDERFRIRRSAPVWVAQWHPGRPN